jgi:hypothetical protein
MPDDELTATRFVETENVAEDVPANTVTVEGTVAAAVLLDESATTAPPVGAAPFRVTVAWEDVPPVTLLGLSETADKAGGITVKIAPWLLEL